MACWAWAAPERGRLPGPLQPRPNNRLRKNYRVLNKLNTKHNTKVSRAKLVEHGFDFNYITSIYKTKAGAVYYFLYDQGFLPLEDEFFLLVKREG